MQVIDLGERSVKVELLHEELKAALGDAIYQGLSTGRSVIVHLSDEAGEGAISLVWMVVQEHDADGMTEGERQIIELNEARALALDSLSSMQQADALVQVLRWMAWELTRLRE